MSLPEAELAGVNAGQAAEPVPLGTERKRARFAVSGKSLRVWGLRSVLSLADQGFTSGAGFLVNLLLARWLSVETYGAFAVAFAGYLFISGFHNVLLLEPMSVMGPSRHAGNLQQYFRAQMVIHALMTGALSAAALLVGAVVWRAAPASPLSGAVIGSGIALPFLLLLWLMRRMCYVVQRPSVAVAGSVFYVLFVAAGLAVLTRLGWLGSFAAFLLMGLGSTFAAGILLWRLGLWRDSALQGHFVSWRAALRENWVYGRWLVGSTVLFSVSSHVQTFLAAAILGLSAAGILRAMQLPALVMTQVTAAAGLLVLTSFSYDFGKGQLGRLRHKATFVSLLLVSGILAFAGLLALLSGGIEHLLFDGKYSAYAWLMPVLTLVPAAHGLATGYSMAMRASQKPRFDLLANAIAAPVGVVSAIFFMRWWGIAGAAVSMAVGFAAYAISVCWIYYDQRETGQKRGFST